MLFVTKFGGTSLSCARQFKKVKTIVSADPRRRVIVVSALGKRRSSDNKLTDLFYSIFENRSQSSYYDELWQEVITRFVMVKKELALKYDVASELNHIKDGLAARNLSLDFLVSRGEYLTAKLMAEYLDYQFFDAKDLIIFDASGEVDLVRSYARIKKTINTAQKIVIPGFYGADEFGDIKLFSRGGSDITGAIIAAGLDADLYENFTDVPGVLMVDPRIVKNPLPIGELTYEEMSEIAALGTEVLHRKSVAPVKQAGIAINIKNTNNPQALGTLITCSAARQDQLIGIFGKKDFTFLTLDTSRSTAEIASFMADLKIRIEDLRVKANQLQLLVASVDIKYRFEQIVHELTLKFDVTAVVAKTDFALIKVFKRGSVADLTPLALDYIPLAVGMIAVANADFERVIRALYANLVCGVFD